MKFQKQIKLDGKLQSPDEVYGMRRKDTGEIVVASGTEMTQVSTGIYELEVEDVEAGVEYEFWVRAEIDSADDYVEAYGSDDTAAALGEMHGIGSVTVDGQTIRYDRAQLLEEHKYNLRTEARKSGKRPYSKGIDLSGF